MPFRSFSWLCTSSPCFAILYSSYSSCPPCHQASPLPGSLLPQPQSIAALMSPQAESRQFELPGNGQGEIGGDSNWCAMSYLLIAKSHRPHLCSWLTHGTRGAEIPALWGPCHFSALYHMRVELMASPALPSS